MDWNDKERRTAAALFALKSMRWVWFEDLVSPTDAKPVAELLLEVYSRFRSGELLSKKRAAQAIAVEHKATVRRYIDRAVEIGAIEVKASVHDGRVDLLIPTAYGISIIEKELDGIADFIDWGHALLAHDADTLEGAGVWGPIANDIRASFEQSEIAPRPGEKKLQSLQKIASVATETLNHFPDHYMALALRANANSALRRFGEALPDFDILIERKPDDASLYLDRIRVLIELEDFERAKKDYESVVELAKNNEERALALLFLLEILVRTSNWCKALDVANDVIEFMKVTSLRDNQKEKYLPGALRYRAHINDRLGHFENALRDLQEWKELKQEKHQAGRVEEKLKELENIIRQKEA